MTKMNDELLVASELLVRATAELDEEIRAELEQADPTREFVVATLKGEANEEKD